MAWVNAVSPDWFATYGMRLTAGRGFASANGLGAPPVVVVNEASVGSSSRREVRSATRSRRKTSSRQA